MASIRLQTPLSKLSPILRRYNEWNTHIVNQSAKKKKKKNVVTDWEDGGIFPGNVGHHPVRTNNAIVETFAGMMTSNITQHEGKYTDN
jgi:hypothetical protein